MRSNISILQYLPPLFIFTLIFIGGIAWHAYGAPVAYVAIIIGCLTAFFVYDAQSTYRFYIPWILAAFSIGACRDAFHEYQYLYLAEQLCKKKIDLEGIIVNRETTNNRFTSCLTIAVASCKSVHENINFAHAPLIKLYCTHRINCNYGDTINLKSMYLKQSKNSSYSIFFKKQDIIATGYIGKEQPFIIKANTPVIASWLYNKREALLHTIATTLSPQTNLLFSSIFLGYKTAKNSMSDALYEQFQWWGISHYLARSGLHLVVFVIILHFLFMFLPIPFILKQSIVALCITTYILFSWSSISFIRSILMIFCYIACSMFKMQQHALHTISLACCAILLYNPSHLFALDFQLSFALTLALILLHHAYQLQRSPAKKVLLP